MQIETEMTVIEVTASLNQERVELVAPQADFRDPGSVPGGTLKLVLNNQNDRGKLVLGKTYLLTLVEKEPA